LEFPNAFFPPILTERAHSVLRGGMDQLPGDCGDSPLLDDIEDLIATEEDAPLERLERIEVGRDHGARERRRKRQERAMKKLEDEQSRFSSELSAKLGDNDPSRGEEELVEIGLTNVPGVARVYVKTWGCAHNNSDGEYMAGLLSEYGYEVVIEDDDAKSANVWVLNSCTVKGPAESHFVNTITEAQAMGKKVVVAGCVPQAWGSSKSGKEAEKRANAQSLSVIGVQQIDRVVEVVEQTLLGNTVRLMGTKTEKKTITVSTASGTVVASDVASSSIGDTETTQRTTKIKLGGAKLTLPKIRRNPLVEIVPISTGCLNACTYCKTKHARGHLGSYPIEEIVNRIRHVVSEGVLEIWLTSEDTGAYGIDIGTNITTLLWAILDVLPEPVMLRMGMTNPPYIKRHAVEMAKIYEHPRIYAYLHMPIQSASNSVLEAMKREYSRTDFEEIVDELKHKLPNLNVATDLIIGFPGETDDDFDDTWNLVQKYQFSVLFINQFYPRPGTPAAKMKRVNTQIVKDRTRKLSSWFKSYLPYENRLNEIHRVLVTEMAPDNIHVAGRTKSYEMVLVDSDLPAENLMGRVIEVKISETGKFFLKGTPTENGLATLETQSLPKETVLRRLPRTGKVLNGQRLAKTSSSSSSSPPEAQSASSIKTSSKERLDYHEGDDGEDYEENSAMIDEEDDEEEETTGECGDCGDACGSCNTDSTCSPNVCDPNGCADCGSNASTEQKTKQTAIPSSSAPAHSQLGPSDKISLSPKRSTGIQFKVKAQEGADGLTSTQKIFGLFVLLIGILLMNWPFIKRIL
jgi:threonylcarbamoyladenosine tRNA methylthiotransferase CDKAL1